MIFNRPFPANTSFATTVRYSCTAGLIVSLILFLFRPFHIDAPGNNFSFLHALAYGMATTVMLLLNSVLLPLIFKDAFKEEGWTLGKEILMMCWHIFTIAFINVLVTHLLYGTPMNFARVLSFLVITAAVGIFPVSFILMVKQQVLFKRFQQNANAIEQELVTALPAEQPQTAKLPEPVFLKGDNAGEELRLDAELVRYITAADNYLRVIYISDGKQQTRVLRGTLKKAEQMLADHPQFLRCHRAYIVNLSAVKHLSGNAQGLKLHLENVEELIPVSRSQNESLPDILRKHTRLSR